VATIRSQISASVSPAHVSAAFTTIPMATPRRPSFACFCFQRRVWKNCSDSGLYPTFRASSITVVRKPAFTSPCNIRGFRSRYRSHFSTALGHRPSAGARSDLPKPSSRLIAATEGCSSTSPTRSRSLGLRSFLSPFTSRHIASPTSRWSSSKNNTPPSSPRTGSPDRLCTSRNAASTTLRSRFSWPNAHDAQRAANSWSSFHTSATWRYRYPATSGASPGARYTPASLRPSRTVPSGNRTPSRTFERALPCCTSWYTTVSAPSVALVTGTQRIPVGTLGSWVTIPGRWCTRWSDQVRRVWSTRSAGPRASRRARSAGGNTGTSSRRG
jgi:hypothetical protein